MGNRRTPEDRAENSKKEIARVRRRYKTNVKRRTKVMPVQEDYIDNMVCIFKIAGYSNTQAAQAIGISKGQVKEILEKPHVVEQIAILHAQIPQAAVDLLQSLMIEAVISIADVMRTATDDKTIIAAAESILDRGGAPKVSRQDRSNVNEERVTIVDDGIVDRLRQASPEVQEEAAQLIEQLEGILLQASTESMPEDETT